MLSRRKPIGIGSDLIEKWVKISYTKICDSSLRPCIPAILHPCDPAPLRPYTLHLTFSFFHFAILAFRSRQNAKWQEQAGTRCLPTPATFYAFLSFFFITRGDTSRRAGPHPPLSPHDVAIPGYGASRRRSAYAACRWVCRSPRR